MNHKNLYLSELYSVKTVSKNLKNLDGTNEYISIDLGTPCSFARF